MDYIVSNKKGEILSRHFTAKSGKDWIEKETAKWKKYGMQAPYMRLYYNGIQRDITVTVDSSGNEILPCPNCGSEKTYRDIFGTHLVQVCRLCHHKQVLDDPHNR